METIDVTQGQNGYPQGIYTAIKFDTLEELKEYAETNTGRMVMLRRRDGWHFYENRGNFYGKSLLDIPVGETEYVLRTTPEAVKIDAWKHVVGEYENIGEYLADCFCSVHDIPDAISILEDLQKRIDEIIETADQPCLIFFDMNNQAIDTVIRLESTSYRYDVWTYQLAFIPENE